MELFVFIIGTLVFIGAVAGLLQGTVKFEEKDNES